MRPRPYLVSLLSDNIGAGAVVVPPSPSPGQSGSPPLLGLRNAVAPRGYRLEYVVERFERALRATRRLGRVPRSGDVEDALAPGAA